MVRALRFHHGFDPSEDCRPTPPTETMVAALDAAVGFAASREVLTPKDVASVFAMLRIAAPVVDDTARAREALELAATSLASQTVVRGRELADRLLDVRLVVRPPRDQRSSGGDAVPDWHALVSA